MDLSNIDPIHMAVAVVLGIALSAACGLRVFIPLLTLSIGARTGLVSLGSGFEWLGSWTAMGTLALACVLELVAMHIPVVQHAMDVLLAPLSAVAGTVVMASQMGFVNTEGTAVREMSPLVMWTCATIVGGGAAVGVHSLAAILRGGSSLLTSGIGGVVMTAVESIGALIASILAIAAPVCAAVILAIAVIPVTLLVIRVLKKRQAAAAAQPAA